MGLPQHVSQVTFFLSPSLAEGRLYAFVTPSADQKSFKAEVLDEQGNCYLTLEEYQTIALPDFVDLESIRNLQAILLGEPVAA